MCHLSVLLTAFGFKDQSRWYWHCWLLGDRWYKIRFRHDGSSTSQHGERCHPDTLRARYTRTKRKISKSPDCKCQSKPWGAVSKSHLQKRDGAEHSGWARVSKPDITPEKYVCEWRSAKNRGSGLVSNGKMSDGEMSQKKYIQGWAKGRQFVCDLVCCEDDIWLLNPVIWDCYLLVIWCGNNPGRKYHQTPDHCMVW